MINKSTIVYFLMVVAALIPGGSISALNNYDQTRKTDSDNLNQLLASVERNNLQLKGLREQLKASEYELKEENTLDATSVEYSPFFRSGVEGIESSELIVSQEFDFPTLYAARDKSAGRRMDLLRQEYEVSCRDLLLQAAGVYLDIVRLERIKESLVIQRDNSLKTLELFTKRLDAGDVTAIDLNRIKIQVMDLERDIMANSAERTELMSTLSSLNGYEDPKIDFDCYPAWTYSTSSPSADNDAEVKAAALEVESCKAMESVARQGWVPKLTLGYRRNTALDEASHGLIVGASFPLFSASSKVKTAKARKAAAEIEAEEIRKRVDNDYDAALKGLEFIRQSMEIFDLNLLDETERLLEKSLEAGAINITDYYAELATVNEKRIGYIELEYEYYKKLCVLYRNDIKNNSK